MRCYDQDPNNQAASCWVAGFRSYILCCAAPRRSTIRIRGERRSSSFPTPWQADGEQCDKGRRTLLHHAVISSSSSRSCINLLAIVATGGHLRQRYNSNVAHFRAVGGVQICRSYGTSCRISDSLITQSRRERRRGHLDIVTRAFLSQVATPAIPLWGATRHLCICIDALL